eukprot:jgi/Picsp_1/79/NSC_00079-R1_---NA---
MVTERRRSSGGEDHGKSTDAANQMNKTMQGLDVFLGKLRQNRSFLQDGACDVPRVNSDGGLFGGEFPEFGMEGSQQDGLLSPVSDVDCQMGFDFEEVSQKVGSPGQGASRRSREDEAIETSPIDGSEIERTSDEADNDVVYGLLSSEASGEELTEGDRSLEGRHVSWANQLEEFWDGFPRGEWKARKPGKSILKKKSSIKACSVQDEVEVENKGTKWSAIECKSMTVSNESYPLKLKFTLRRCGPPKCSKKRDRTIAFSY